MKKAVITLLLISFCYIAPAAAKDYKVEEIPLVHLSDRTRYVSNPDGILSRSTERAIDAMLLSLEEQTGIQTLVAVVTGIEGSDCFDFAYRLGQSAGVGQQGRDNGLVILLSTEERCVQFVTGYGLEGVLPDAICKRIQTQYMLPYFSNGDYSRGMVAGLEAIRAVLNGSELDAGLNDDYYEEDDEFIAVLMTLFVIMVFGSMILVLIIDRASRKCPNCKQLALQKDSVRVLSHNFGATTYEDTFVCTKGGTIVKRKRQDYDSNNNRRGGGPIIMGGFGGGSSFGGGWGGGSFGGGGAGSRW